MDLLLKNLTIIENRLPAIFGLFYDAKAPEAVFLEKSETTKAGAMNSDKDKVFKRLRKGK